MIEVKEMKEELNRYYLKKRNIGPTIMLHF